MATTAKVMLSEQQRQQLADDLRLQIACIPAEIAVIAVSPEAGRSLGLPSDQAPHFSPALIVT